LTVSHAGNVNANAIPLNAQAARFLPATASHVDSGKVINSSMLPIFLSSAQSRIDKVHDVVTDEAALTHIIERLRTDWTYIKVDEDTLKI